MMARQGGPCWALMSSEGLPCALLKAWAWAFLTAWARAFSRAPWALMGPGPLWPPWALMAPWALMGPGTSWAPRALMGPGPLWALGV